MSDLVGKLSDDFNSGAIRPVEPFESVWTVHQRLKSRMEATRVGNGHSSHIESQAQDYIANKHRSTVRLENDVSGSECSDFAEVTEARTVRIKKNGVVASSETLIRERIGGKRHSFFNISQSFKTDDRKNELNLSSLRHVARSPIDSSSEYNAHGAPDIPLLTVPKVSHPPQEWSGNNKNEAFLYDSLPFGEPSGDKYSVSNQKAINMGKLPALSSVGKRKMYTQFSRGVESKEDKPSTSFTVLGHEHHSYRSSTLLVSREKEVDHQSASRIYEGSFSKRCNSPFPLQDPFSGKNHSLEDGGLQYHKVHGFAGNENFPSQNYQAGPIIREKLHSSSNSSRKTPHSVHDKETMISCGPNFLDGSAGGTSSYPQRTNNLSSLEETHCNPSKKKHPFWESANPANVKRNTSTKFLTFPSSGMGQRGVEFHPAGIVTESVEKDRHNNKSPEIHLKSESSADTDTMVIGDQKEQTEFSGINSSPLNQMALNPPSQAEKASVAETPIRQAAFNLVNDTTLSTSKTLSLEADHLTFPHQATKRKSINSSSTPEATDSSSRWLKRLRSSTPDSFALGLGNGYPNVEETSPHTKVGGTSITLAKGKYGGSLGNRAALLSETWIKRWCCNRATPEAVAPFEPQCGKEEESDKFQNKQFPSIAAMALMGRAMSGFRPCEFQCRGTFVVWNTNDSILN